MTCAQRQRHQLLHGAPWSLCGRAAGPRGRAPPHGPQSQELLQLQSVQPEVKLELTFETVIRGEVRRRRQVVVFPEEQEGGGEAAAAAGVVLAVSVLYHQLLMHSGHLKVMMSGLTLKLPLKKNKIKAHRQHINLPHKLQPAAGGSTGCDERGGGRGG